MPGFLFGGALGVRGRHRRPPWNGWSAIQNTIERIFESGMSILPLTSFGNLTHCAWHKAVPACRERRGPRTNSALSAAAECTGTGRLARTLALTVPPLARSCVRFSRVGAEWLSRVPAMRLRSDRPVRGAALAMRPGRRDDRPHVWRLHEQMAVRRSDSETVACATSSAMLHSYRYSVRPRLPSARTAG